MKKNVFISIILSLLFGCSDGSGISAIEDLVISDKAPKKVYFTLSLQAADGDHLLLDQIDSIELEIDGKAWGYFKSEKFDTTVVNPKLVSNNFFVNEKKIEYLVIDQYFQQDTTTITTAGQVIGELKSRILLNPGDHVARVKELKIENRAGEFVLINSIEYVHFHITNDDETVYVGEFQIKTNL